MAIRCFGFELGLFLHRSRTSISVSRSSSSRNTIAAAYNLQSGIYSSDRRKIKFPESEFIDFATFVLSRKATTISIENEVALIDGITGQELSFDQVGEKTRSLGAVLRRSGVEQGDVVMILAPNSVFYPVAVMAAASIGAVAATPSPVGSVKDIKFQSELANAKIVITTPDLLFKTRDLGLETLVMNNDGSIECPAEHQLKESLDSLTRIHRDDPAAILFSSGTTGMSKAVMLSHGNIVSQILQLADDDLYESLDPDQRELPYDVPVCALPLSHIFGLVAVTLKHLFLGNQLVILPGFDLRTMLAAIESFRISHLYVVPPVIVTLAKVLQKVEYDLASLRAILCGAAPLGEEQVRTLRRFLPNASFFQLYGITEAAGALTFNDTAASGRFASAGNLLSNVEAKVLDVVSGAALPPLSQGELLLRSPTIMIGYMNNSEATKLAMTSEGWLKTGDLVYFDDFGNLFVVDRIKELIKYKTLQVAPAELEALLLTHPLVLDAAVVAAKDDHAGEVPVAFVVPCLADGKITEQQLKAFVARNVAAHKRIKKILFIDAIPKTPSGKILRKELKKLAHVACHVT